MEGLIDIHCHIIYGVDDGAASREISLEMLRAAAEHGVVALAATPHYRRGMFEAPAALIEERFQDLKQEADRLGIMLVRGCEYFVDSEIFSHLSSGRVKALGDTNCVLTEYAPSAAFGIVERYTQELLRSGYIPVIAHVERIGAVSAHMEYAWELSRMGARLQVNADSVLGREGLAQKLFCKRLFRHELVDFVASDAHNMKRRSSHLAECAAYVERKMGKGCAQAVFHRHAAELLGI